MCEIKRHPDDGRTFVELCDRFLALAGARIYYDRRAPLDDAGRCWDGRDPDRITLGELVAGQGDDGRIRIGFKKFWRRPI